MFVSGQDKRSHRSRLGEGFVSSAPAKWPRFTTCPGRHSMPPGCDGHTQALTTQGPGTAGQGLEPRVANLQTPRTRRVVAGSHPTFCTRAGGTGQARQGQPSGAFGGPRMSGALGRTSNWGSRRMGTGVEKELPLTKYLLHPRWRTQEACHSTCSVHACDAFATRVMGWWLCTRPWGDSSEQTSSLPSHGAHLLVGEQTRKSRKNEYEVTGERAPPERN